MLLRIGLSKVHHPFDFGRRGLQFVLIEEPSHTCASIVVILLLDFVDVPVLCRSPMHIALRRSRRRVFGRKGLDVTGGMELQGAEHDGRSERCEVALATLRVPT